jgi:hypothetical protein
MGFDRFSLILLKYEPLIDKFSEKGSIFNSHLLALAVFKDDSTLFSSIDDTNGLEFNFLIEESVKLFLLNFVLKSGITNADSIEVKFLAKYLLLCSLLGCVTKFKLPLTRLRFPSKSTSE